MVILVFTAPPAKDAAKDCEVKILAHLVLRSAEELTKAGGVAKFDQPATDK